MVGVSRLRLDDDNLGLLSPLENDVLLVLWKEKDAMKVRDIYKVVKKGQDVALTSVAVILDRLYKKGIVTREVEMGRGGGHYLYTAKPREEFEKSVVKKTVDTLIDRFGSSAVAYFNERFSGRK